MITISDGRIIIDTEIDSKGAEKGVSSLGGKLGSIAKTGLKAFTGLIVGAGTAISGLGAIGVKYNSEMEQYMSSFTTMLGSTEKATKHLDDLKRFAAKTPFELGDLAKASTTLQAFGTDVKDINPILKMLGDISLGNKEKFNGLALVFGQVQSQGKLMGQDLMQMINQGFNPLQIISEKTGKSMSELKDEMSKGQISFEMVAEAMQIATSEGGKFYNAMEGQSKTLVGQWSTLKDNVGALLGDMFTSVSDTLKNKVLPAINDVVDKLQESFANGNLKDSINRIAESFGNLITKLAELTVDWLPKIIEGFAWFLDNGEGIAIIIGTITASIVAFKAAAVITTIVQSWQEAKVALALYKMTADGATISQGVMNGVFTVWETIVALMTGKISLATAATGLWSKATAALNAMWAANPIGIVIVAIVALVGAIIYLWNTNEGFRNAIINAWNAIKEAGKAVWGWLVQFFTVDIPSAWNSMVAWFGSVGDWFVDLWNNIKQGFVNGWNSIVSFFTVSIPAWWEGVKQQFQDGLVAIKNFFTETIPALMVQVGEWFNELPYRIGYALGYALGAIAKWGVDTWNSFTTTCVNVYNAVTEWFSKLPERVYTFTMDVYNKIVKWGQDTWNNFIETCTNIYNSVTEWFSKLPGLIWDWLVNAYNKIVTWGTNTYNSMVSAITNAINAVVDWFSTLPSRVWEWLVNTISKVVQFASNLASKASEAGSNMVSNIISAVSNLPSQMAEIGSNIVHGVWNGITGMGSWLASKVSGFFSGIVDGAKKALGIHSPSRVFRDQVGKYMAQGVGVGFEDETDNIKSDMQDSLSNLTAKMQATVDYETSVTTARVVAYNKLSGDVETESNASKERPIVVHAHFDVDGKEFTQTVVAPNQDVLTEYYEGR